MFDLPDFIKATDHDVVLNDSELIDLPILNKTSLNKEKVASDNLPITSSSATVSEIFSSPNPATFDSDAAQLYNSHLLNERRQIMQEKLNTERLSHSIESHVIEDAKVCIHF